MALDQSGLTDLLDALRASGDPDSKREADRPRAPRADRPRSRGDIVLVVSSGRSGPLRSSAPASTNGPTRAAPITR